MSSKENKAESSSPRKMWHVRLTCSSSSSTFCSHFLSFVQKKYYRWQQHQLLTDTQALLRCRQNHEKFIQPVLQRVAGTLRQTATRMDVIRESSFRLHASRMIMSWGSFPSSPMPLDCGACAFGKRVFTRFHGVFLR
jgi:hypothetical protein